MKENEFSRYSRQVFMDEIGVVGQRKIMQTKVLVVGAGGLGSPVIQYLAAAGIGVVGVVDFDKVELHNLNRQTIHSEKSVGLDKVESAAAFVKSLNSHISFIPILEKITQQNVLDIVKDFDIVVDGSDNFEARYIVNDACVVLNKPLVYGSIFSFEGQVAVFNFKGSKNLRDLFPESPDTEDVPNCDSNGVLGPLPGIVGSMMAMQTIKIITDLPVNINQLTIIDTLYGRFATLDF